MKKSFGWLKALPLNLSFLCNILAETSTGQEIKQASKWNGNDRYWERKWRYPIKRIGSKYVSSGLTHITQWSSLFNELSLLIHCPTLIDSHSRDRFKFIADCVIYSTGPTRPPLYCRLVPTNASSSGNFNRLFGLVTIDCLILGSLCVISSSTLFGFPVCRLLHRLTGDPKIQHLPKSDGEFGATSSRAKKKKN